MSLFAIVCAYVLFLRFLCTNGVGNMFLFVAVQVCHDVSGGAVAACGVRLHRAVFILRASFDLVLLADRRQHQLCVHIWFCVDVSAVVHQPPAEECVAPALEGIVASI